MDDQRVTELAKTLFSKGLAASLWDATNKARDILGITSEKISKDEARLKAEDDSLNDIMKGAGVSVNEVDKATEIKIDEVSKEFNNPVEDIKDEVPSFDLQSREEDETIGSEIGDEIFFEQPLSDQSENGTFSLQSNEESAEDEPIDELDREFSGQELNNQSEENEILSLQTAEESVEEDEAADEYPSQIEKVELPDDLSLDEGYQEPEEKSETISEMPHAFDHEGTIVEDNLDSAFEEDISGNNEDDDYIENAQDEIITEDANIGQSSEGGNNQEQPEDELVVEDGEDQTDGDYIYFGPAPEQKDDGMPKIIDEEYSDNVFSDVDNNNVEDDRNEDYI